LLSKAAELGGDFTDLLDAAAVDELISTHGLRTPFLRMAKDGKDLPKASFTRSAGAGATMPDQAADDKVLSAMASGTTLVLHALHRTWAPLVHFGEQLTRDLGHPVQINSYVTPPQSQGFAPHYDVHDVFVLQVAGRKQWTIHEPVVTDPLDNQPWTARKAEVESRAAQEPVIDTVLEPGDAMYLPRGTIHAAKALGETSIHLTVGLHPITGYHLARYLLELAQDDDALRASLPMGVDLSDPTVLADHLTDTVQKLTARLAQTEPAPVARQLGKDLRRRTRPAPVGPLGQLTAADNLTPDTAVRLRAGLRYELEALDGTVRLHMVDRTIDLPPAAANAAKSILTGEPVTAAQLPGLDPDAQLALIRSLLHDGVVVPA
jgi:hypothetical protein